MITRKEFYEMAVESLKDDEFEYRFGCKPVDIHSFDYNFGCSVKWNANLEYEYNCYRIEEEYV